MEETIGSVGAGSDTGAVDTGTPSGGTSPSVGTSGGTAQGGSISLAEAKSTNPVDISDDTLVRIPGQATPVKYGDLYKRLQADHTRKTQAAEKLRQQYQTQNQQVAQERSRLEQIAASLVQRQNQPQGDQSANDPFLTELGQAKYIDGAMAVKMVQQIQQGGFAPIAKAIQDRDKIITGLYQQVVNLSKTVQQINGRFSGQDFEGKIDRWMSDGGYPTEAKQLAKEIYLAYEGEDLDQEFPAIFQERWNQIQGILEAQRKSKVDAARAFPKLPGKGGAGVAPRGISFKGNETPKQITDALWDSLQNNE